MLAIVIPGYMLNIFFFLPEFRKSFHQPNVSCKYVYLGYLRGFAIIKLVHFFVCLFVLLEHEFELILVCGGYWKIEYFTNISPCYLKPNLTGNK